MWNHIIMVPAKFRMWSRFPFLFSLLPEGSGVSVGEMGRGRGSKRHGRGRLTVQPALLISCRGSHGVGVGGRRVHFKLIPTHGWTFKGLTGDCCFRCCLCIKVTVGLYSEQSTLSSHPEAGEEIPSG